MGHHDLKTWPEPFAAVVAGVKRYEIRSRDRDYHVGDTLLLLEWDPAATRRDWHEPKGYSGREHLVRVTYMTDGGQWGLPANMCVMSIEPCSTSAIPTPEKP